MTAERRRLASAYRQRVSTGGLVNNHPLAASDGGDPSSDVVLGDPAGTGAGSAVNNNAARPSPDAALDIDSEEQAPQITLEDNKKLAIKPKFVHIRYDSRFFTCGGNGLTTFGSCSTVRFARKSLQVGDFKPTELSSM